MESESLISLVKKLQARDIGEFAKSLDSRKTAERDWANFSRDKGGHHHMPGQTNETSRGNYKWYSTTQLSEEYRQQWLREKATGKVFLDYACGNGEQAIEVAKMGAALSLGMDLSEVSVGNATEWAEHEGVSDNCLFLTGDCENTGLPDNSIDVIGCKYVLHHMALENVYKEMFRILKPGGCVLAAEALAYNPAIKLYRKLTPEMRTEWEKEHILSLKEVRMAKDSRFNIGSIRYWHIFSILGAFVRRLPPVFDTAMPVLNALDRVAMKIPGVQQMAWIFTFELFKPRQ